jgi:hypothetical protein
MNPLLSRLATLRRRVRLLEGWQGICALLTVIVGAVLLAGLLDWWVQLPSLIRGGLLVAIVTASGVLAYRYLFVPLRSPCDDLTLALRIEEEFPELNDALASTVQFLTEPADSPGAASSSQAMRKKAVQQTALKAEQYDFSRIISYRGAIVLGVSLLAVAAVAAHFAYRHAEFSGIALLRLADPFGGHTWTTVDVNAPKRIAVGQAFAVKATLAGVIPALARVEIMNVGEDESKPEQRELRVQRETSSIFMPVDKTKYTRKFQFRVLANDGTFPRQPGKWHVVDVLEPPVYANLGGKPSPQIDVYPPTYTGEEGPQELAPGTKMIKAWAGSAIVLRAATNREVEKVWFEYRPSTVHRDIPVPAFRAVSLLGQLGATGPFSAVGDLFGGQTLWERVPAEMESDTVFKVRFTAWNSGVCVVHLEDKDGLPKEYPYELHVEIDPLPVVKLLQPGSNLTLVPDAEATFRFQADDEVFGLRSIYAEYQRTGPDVEVTAPRRAVLQLEPDYEKALPQISAPLVLAPNNDTEPLKHKPKRVEVTSIWRLKGEFKVGDVVNVEICADDYCDVYGIRRPGRSHQIKLQIVSKGELDKIVDEKLKAVQQDLAKIEKIQKNAFDIVKEVEQKDKIDQKDIERLVEAQMLQKQVQEQIGTPDDGLRQELDKLQQLLKDNKMKGKEADERTGMIKGALDQLARQELQQIEPALAQARKELTEKANKEGKENKDKENKDKSQSNKKDDPLAKTTKLQDKSLKNLAELRQALNPWAEMQDVKDEVRSIKQQQEDTKKNLDAVKEKEAALEDAGNSKAVQEEKDKLRDELKKEADKLEDLAKRAEGLQKKLREMQAKREEQKDKDNADRLKEAAKIGDKAGLPAKMRETSKELKDTARQGKNPEPSHQAQQQQQKNIDNLDQMLKALDGKDDNALKLKKDKIKKAEEEVEKLTKKAKELEKKLEEANKLKDQEERLQKRKDLANEFQELADKAEEKARELARLQEQRASKDLDKVAEDLQKAADKLKQGQDAGEEPKDAQQKLADAKKALEQSEEELAREQLAKVADRLQGLKERQDAAVDRTKELHKKVMAKKTWTEPLQRTLENDTTAQQGLAKEVRSLKEKIKEAKVFEHLMERAAKSMDNAVGVMEERKENSGNRKYDPKAGDSMPKEELDDEEAKNKETLANQTEAAKRMKRLIDAIKEELAKKPPEEKKDNANAQEKKEGDQGGPKLRAADGIPPIAQLKLLRSEQADLNERTESFNRRNPNTNNLAERERLELDRLQQDQRNLQELFRQITTTAEKKGDAP